jgi:hypothetical protein
VKIKWQFFFEHGRVTRPGTPLFKRGISLLHFLLKLQLIKNRARIFIIAKKLRFWQIQAAFLQKYFLIGQQ